MFRVFCQKEEDLLLFHKMLEGLLQGITEERALELATTNKIPNFKCLFSLDITRTAHMTKHCIVSE